MVSAHFKNERRHNPKGFEEATTRKMTKMRTVRDGNNKLRKISPQKEEHGRKLRRGNSGETRADGEIWQLENPYKSENVKRRRARSEGGSGIKREGRREEGFRTSHFIPE
jgi:hypothetical protein